MTQQALDVVDRGRETMSDLLSRSQDAVSELMPRRRTTTTSSYLWFGMGAATAAAALLLGARRGWRAWGSRRVRDVMVPDVETIDASATLMQAAQRMRDANVGVLPIVEGGRIRGVITDRDLVVRGMARGVDPASTRVIECATKETVSAHPDWTVDEAMATMAGHQIGRLPVIDDSGRVTGIVTLSSLALRSSERDEALDTARAVSLRSARAS
jgi:CBS domain-containing protein